MKILIIQTAFIGDVILATALLESIHKKNPEDNIDFLLRKGNEALLEGNPNIDKVIIWDKSKGKYKNLFEIARVVRSNKYDLVINLQRFGATGYITWKSKAKIKVGFKSNPFSFSFTHKINHEIGQGLHEIERNKRLIDVVGDYENENPRLYPSDANFQRISELIKGDVIVMAPSSVWFTKQLPKEKWLEIIDQYDDNSQVALIGAPSDKAYLSEFIKERPEKNLINLAGELSLLESAALMSKAKMNHVNDSAPLHLASAMDAPVTAYFCSTIPEFGFGPLSTNSSIKEISNKLDCRPCGLHGFKECPKGHFNCGHKIDVTL